MRKSNEFKLVYENIQVETDREPDYQQVLATSGIL